VIAQDVISRTDSIPYSLDRRLSPGRGVHWTNPLKHENWDDRVGRENHDSYSFFHTTAWAKVLTGTYQYDPVYFISEGTGAVLPLMEVNSGLTGKRAVALPFTDICDPLCADKADFDKLFRNAVELGQARGWNYLEFRGGDAFFQGTVPSLAFYRHCVEIPADAEAYFAQLPGPVRRAIRKAEKSDLQIEISPDFAAIKQYYLLHCKSRKRHGLPPQPFSFFKNLHQHALSRGLGIVVLARWRNVPVAGAVFLHSGDRAIYKFGASDDSFQQLRGNNLVFREAIKWFSRNGIRKLDLGRTSTGNEGLRRFKLGWNAEETIIRYYRFCFRQNDFVPMRDEGLGWHNYVFKALPLPASRMAGEFLYRHWG
jgi:hypothetical protein